MVPVGLVAAGVEGDWADAADAISRNAVANVAMRMGVSGGGSPSEWGVACGRATLMQGTRRPAQSIGVRLEFHRSNASSRHSNARTRSQDSESGLGVRTPSQGVETM